MKLEKVPFNYNLLGPKDGKRAPKPVGQVIAIESVDYSKREVTITDGKRSKSLPVNSRDGSISRLAPGIELDMTFEQFAQMFFCPKYEFYTPTTVLSVVGYYYGEASE